MVFIYLLSTFIFIQCLGMEEYQGDLIPRFEPSEQAAQYKPLQKAYRSTNLEKYAPELAVEKKSAFVECLTQPRPDHLDQETLNFVLDDPILLEAVLAHTINTEFRNEFIKLFFFGSLMWSKAEALEFLTRKNLDLARIRSVYDETPGEFELRLNKNRLVKKN